MRVTKRRVEQVVRDWRGRAGLAPEHVVAVRVFPTEDSQPDKTNLEAPATISVEDGFETSVLEVHAWNVRDDAHLEWTVLHELLHTHTSQLATVLEAHVTDLASVIEHELIRRWLRSLWRMRYGCEPPRRGASGAKSARPRKLSGRR